jgi:hypothetical protein
MRRRDGRPMQGGHEQGVLHGDWQQVSAGQLSHSLFGDELQ